jgi:hypothetical protein
MNVKFRLGFSHFFLLHYKIQCNYLFLSNLLVLSFISEIATVLYSSKVCHQVALVQMKVPTKSLEIHWLYQGYCEELRLEVE